MWKSFTDIYSASLIVIIIACVVCLMIYLICKRKADTGFFKNRKGKTVCWDKKSFPINVIINPLISKKYLDICLYVVKYLNANVGNILLTPTIVHFEKSISKASEVPSNSIYITQSNKTNGGLNNYKYNPITYKLISSFITVDKVDDNLIFTVIAHGIGHGLGLGHDDNKKSVMYPLINGIEKKRFTRNNIKLLKKKYDC